MEILRVENLTKYTEKVRMRFVPLMAYPSLWIRESLLLLLVHPDPVNLHCFIFWAVTTFASSVLNFAKESTIYSGGNWHAYQKNTDYDTYTKIWGTGKVEEAVYLQQLGHACAEECENEFKPYIYVLGAGKDVEEVLPIHITSGKYPTTQTEMMLPNHLYTNGGVKYNLGDTITLELGQRMLDGYPMEPGVPCYVYEQSQEVFNGETLDIKEKRTYTVVGFYERLSWRIEDFESPGYTALTVSDKETYTPYKYDIYFRMENPREIFDYIWS